jgi:hypothetical protein
MVVHTGIAQRHTPGSLVAGKGRVPSRVLAHRTLQRAIIRVKEAVGSALLP